MSTSDIWIMYSKIAAIAVPVTFIFGVGNILYDIISRAFFSGKLHFGGVFDA